MNSEKDVINIDNDSDKESVITEGDGIYIPAIGDVLEFTDSKSIDDKLKELTKSTDELPSYFQIDKSEIEKTESSILAKPTKENDELKNLVTQHYKYYQDKYGISVSYENIEGYLKFSQLASKDDQKLKELITSELISVTSNYIIIKAILTAAKVLDSLLTAFMRREYTQDVSEASLLTLDKVFDYISKFEDIKRKFKLHDLDEAIKRIQHISEKDMDNDTETSVKLLNILKDSLNKESNE